MDDVVLRRKAYDRLLEWKGTRNGETALLIQGPRRSGKTTLVKRFAEKEYRTSIIIDFRKLPERIKYAFNNDAGHLDIFFEKLSFHYRTPLYRRESLIVFDEVQLFPRARQMIQTLLEDGRYDFIEIGSLVSNYENVKDIRIPYGEEDILLGPLDFEEFLWAMGREDPFYWMRKIYSEGGSTDFLGRVMMDDLRRYMIVGGMPAAVAEYATSGDLRKVEDIKRDILETYRSECEPSVRRIFDDIPSVMSGRMENPFDQSRSDDDVLADIMWLYDS